jgi:hypothetical protein
VRRVDDPIAKTTATIDEYCAGNRVVTVRGPKVTIADYGRTLDVYFDKTLSKNAAYTIFSSLARTRDGRSMAAIC